MSDVAEQVEDVVGGELSQEDGEVVEKFVQAFVDGTPMAEIFEIPEQYLEMVEEQAYNMYNVGQYDTAETLLKGVRGLDDKRYYPHLLLGDIYLRQNRLEDAEVVLQKAYELEPEDACIVLKNAELHVRRGRQVEGKGMLEKVLTMTDETNAHHRRAQVLLSAIARPDNRVEQADLGSEG